MAGDPLGSRTTSKNFGDLAVPIDNYFSLLAVNDVPYNTSFALSKETLQCQTSIETDITDSQSASC
jgi:hypothetical protein